jgi:hypothetical protein
MNNGDIDLDNVDEDGEQATAKFFAAITEKKNGNVRLLEEAWNIPNLIERAKFINRHGLVEWPEATMEKQGKVLVEVAKSNADRNRFYAFDLLFPKDACPYLDTFQGRPVDHRGRVADDKLDVSEYMEALAIMGLRDQKFITVRQSIIHYALRQQKNGLINRLDAIIPEWDGTPRMRNNFVKMFECRETELNFDFSEYWWLALWNRMTNPGCIAPSIAAFIGEQGSGKSLFSNRICQIVLGNNKVESVGFDFSRPMMENLRAITGKSIIANVAEMSGFDNSDLNQMKNFTSRSSDMIHFKYEGEIEQFRQWIIVMDSNRYEGLQRDQTGNRRFYPIFVGQLPDVNGKPSWRKDFKVDFTGFDEDCLQILAECRAWMLERGEFAYTVLCREISDRVKEFSANEMNRDSGTIGDEDLDVFLVSALRIVPTHRTNRRDRYPVGSPACAVQCDELVKAMKECGYPERNVRWPRVRAKIRNYGAHVPDSSEEQFLINGCKGYYFPDGIKLPAGDDGEVVEKREQAF